MKPKLLELAAAYTRKDFGSDAVAGVTVGLVALPLAMAFGIASGVTPQAGLYTAIVGGLIVALFGGSRTQVAGPTGAFVVIVAGIVAKYGISGLLMVTMMAGIILVVLGLTGLGNAVKFIPRPVVIGFTNGIAVLIASTQIRDFLGLRMRENPSEFFARAQALASHIGSVSPSAVGAALFTLAVILIVPKFLPRVPAVVVGVVACTLAAHLLHLPIETIGSHFGAIPGNFPLFALPALHADLILPLLPSAFTVAILAAVESLLSAVVADSLTGDRHNSNAELVAQGLANLIVPLVGGIPVTGAIARTATNSRAGAKSPVSAIVHSLTLLAIVLLCAPLAGSIPLAALAAALMVVAYRIGEWHEIRTILHLDRADKAVWLVTFALTVVASLNVAVEVGIALAALLYIYRISETTTVSVVTAETLQNGRMHILEEESVPPYVTILRIHGPFLFGTTDKLFKESAQLAHFAPIVILRLGNMTALDATGLHALETLCDQLKRSGRTLLLCGAPIQPAQLLGRTAFVAHIGAENLLPNIQAALQRSQEIHNTFDGVAPELAQAAM